MKKTYTKPELLCEEYELSVPIAGNCTIELRSSTVNTSDYKNCSFKMGFDKLFIENNICETIPEGDGDNGICYQQPFANSLVFSS